MRILIVRTTADKPNKGNYNLQEIGLAKALVKKNHICDVVYYNGKNADTTEQVVFEDDKSMNILWLKGFNIAGEAYYPSLKKIIDNYDIIQVGGYVGISSLWLNRKCQYKVVNYQGPYYCINNKKDNLRAAVLDKVMLPFSKRKGMIAIAKSKLAEDYIVKKGIKNVTTLGVGLDVYNIQKNEANEFADKLLKEKEDKQYLLYIGKLEERRNILFLLEIYRGIVDNYDNVRMVIVGDGNPDYVEKVKNSIKELDLEKYIVYKNKMNQTQIGTLYQISDLFILPTKYEIFGMVMLEAMYYGVPVVTTYNGGSSVLIEDDNGMVIESPDAKEWAGKIVGLLQNHRRVELMGENARKTICEKYTWDNLAEEYLKIYKKRIKK